jgi:outer membrane protein TolC
MGFIFGFLGLSFAASEETISLSSLIEQAQKNNPALQALRLHQQGTQEEISQSTFLDDPQFTLTQWGIPRNFNVGQSEQTWLSIEQSFPYPGKRSLKRQIATLDWEISKQEYEGKQFAITAEIKSAYYNLFLAYKMIDLHQEQQLLLNEFIKISEKKYALGQSTQQDLLKAELELEKLHSGRMVLEQDLLANKIKLNALVNRAGSDPMGKPEEMLYRPFPFLYDALTQEAFNNQSHLKSALFDVKKNESMKTLTEKAALPDFMIGLSYWNIHGDEDQFMLMGKMNLPWAFGGTTAGGKYDSKNSKAKLEAEKAMASYNALKNETSSEIQIIFTKIKTAEQLIERYQKRLIPLAKQSLTSAQIGYQSGKTDFQNFIESFRTLLDLQMEYYTQLTDYWQQIAMLSPLIGKEINP